MSTIEDFENAPVGATAEDGKWVKFRPTNDYCSEWVEVLAPSNPKTEGASRSNRDMFCEVYTLDPSPVTPTTAREALNLAWNLAHEVKEGQEIPKGARFLQRDEYGLLREEVILDDWKYNTPPDNIRTMDPLPDPEPEWLDAPAVLASMDECSWQKVWVPKSGGNWTCTCCGTERHWSELEDVTPLYPEGKKA